MKRAIDLVRLTLSCVGFVVIEPEVQKAVGWPDPLPQAFSVIVSAVLAWAIFEVASPMTFISVEWIDIERKVTLEGNVLDLAPKTGTQARVYTLKMTRKTPAWLGSLVLQTLARRDFRITVDANQAELLMDISSIGVERYARHEDDAIVVRLDKDSHSATAARVDLALDWSATTDESLRAEVRYTATANGKWGWCLTWLVVLQPQTTTIRKIPQSV